MSCIKKKKNAKLCKKMLHASDTFSFTKNVLFVQFQHWLLLLEGEKEVNFTPPLHFHPTPKNSFPLTRLDMRKDVMT